MNAWMPLGLRKPEPMDSFYFYPTQYVKKQAIKANLAFDESVKQYLRHWIEQGTVASNGLSLAGEHDIDEFVEYGALRCYFKHHDNALERLLQQDDIAKHLLRPSTEVYFEPDARRNFRSGDRRTFRRRTIRFAKQHRDGNRYGFLSTF